MRDKLFLKMTDYHKSLHPKNKLRILKFGLIVLAIIFPIIFIFFRDKGEGYWEGIKEAYFSEDNFTVFYKETVSEYEEKLKSDTKLHRALS